MSRKRSRSIVDYSAHPVARASVTSLVDAADRRGHGTESRGAALGAASGALVGSFFGPVGALVGGGLGALLGYDAGRSSPR